MATTNTDIAKKLDELAVNFGAFSENVGVRLTILEDGQKRLIDATYGNGEPVHNRKDPQARQGDH